VALRGLSATHKRAQTVSGPPQSPIRSREVSGSQDDIDVEEDDIDVAIDRTLREHTHGHTREQILLFNKCRNP
jgi:hypothetical protein